MPTIEVSTFDPLQDADFLISLKTNDYIGLLLPYSISIFVVV